MTESLHPVRAWRLGQDPKVSLLDLATKVGVSKSFLSRVETGIEKLPVGIGEKIARETGISMRVLFPELARLFEAAE